MLKRKGLDYKRRDLIHAAHIPILKSMGFPGRTVAALRGDEPNAADFQIAPSVRLLMAFDQLRPLIDGRPAAAFATRVVPIFNGHVPAALPADWVPQRT